MIGDYLKNLAKKTDLPYKTSKYLPSTTFYEKALIEIDDGFDMFVKKSVVKVPRFLTIKSFNDFNIDSDKFEEIYFEDNSYKLLYDSVNDVLYLLHLQSTNTGEDIKLDTITLNGMEYVAIIDIMEINNKSELLRIFSRIISDEADEYLFVETDRKMSQKLWAGVVIQPNFIK